MLARCNVTLEFPSGKTMLKYVTITHHKTCSYSSILNCQVFVMNKVIFANPNTHTYKSNTDLFGQFANINRHNNINEMFLTFLFLVLINFFYQKYQSQFNGLNIDLTSFVWYSFTGNALRKHIVHEKSRRFSLNNNNVRSWEIDLTLLFGNTRIEFVSWLWF